MTNSIGRLVRRDPYGGTTFLRRLLQAGFWFFLLKGLLWLAVPALLLAGWTAEPVPTPKTGTEAPASALQEPGPPPAPAEPGDR